MTKDEVNTEHQIINLSARLTATGSQADKEYRIQKRNLNQENACLSVQERSLIAAHRSLLALPTYS